MKTKYRILVIAHAHPDFSYGGGEIAAYSLFKEYRMHNSISEVFFLGRINRDNSPTGNISLYKNNEYLWDQSLGNDFFMEGRNIYASINIFTEFIKKVNPDIVHIHHAVHLGYEIIELIKNCNKNIKIYFTLHEYIPICHNSGQMIKKNGALCIEENFESCIRCFPDKTIGDFWQRKKRFLHYFSFVDAFIAPSEFLRQRYIAWGISPDRIYNLENGLRSFTIPPQRAIKDNLGRNRFAFFGQITPYKGLSILFKGLDILPTKIKKNIIFEIHGANLEQQSEEFQQEIEKYRTKFMDEGFLRWIGPYHPDEISTRMAGIDWVVVPSIWWENSPVTIQEAFACKRPVIASNLGGMAEKIQHGIDGILVHPRNTQAWADTISECCGNNKLFEKLSSGIKAPITTKQSCNDHLKLMGVCND